LRIEQLDELGEVRKRPCQAVDFVQANAPERTQKSREPLRSVVPGLSNKMGVSSVIADGLFGLVFPNDTAAYFLLEVDRGSMPAR